MTGNRNHTKKSKAAAILLLLPLLAFLLFSCPVKRSLFSTFASVDFASSVLEESDQTSPVSSLQGDFNSSCNKCVQTVKKEAVVFTVNPMPVMMSLEALPGIGYHHRLYGIKTLFNSFKSQTRSPDGSYAYLKHQSFLI